ncbi:MULTISPECIES: hypothetical protein [unclassified Frigoribacterium]|uniref:hypothetical protein n=1 Tax=unclassified Frigoribacterium TaxID=2627005 RepID=UPI00135BB954|nr:MULTISPECIES: hypothetical protein [unclassified Frigoribacterium]MBD8486843.1 hypothetical protein [Frigoribacterium sp. CFBP 8759]
MKLLPQDERRWFVAAVVFVLIGCALLLQPFETIPVLGDASFAGRIIGAIGLGIILRTLVLVFRARRDLRRQQGPKP